MNRHSAISRSDDPGLTRDLPILRVEHLRKRYGPNLVLDDVSMYISPGETVALIGENGAGKSTLAKSLVGAIQPDGGAIQIDGSTTTIRSPRDSRRLGIRFIPQELAYFPELSVAENILVGTWAARRGMVSHAAVHAKAAEVARRFGISVDTDRRMGDLTLAERQLVEILKALSSRLRVLILDEPTACLTEHESANLFRVLGRLTAEGVGVLYISHRMDEIRRTDRVEVLRNGRLVASVKTSEATADFLIERMLGQAPVKSRRTSTTMRRSHTRPPAFRLHKWTSDGQPPLRDVDVTICSGEIVSMFGLRGSGFERIADGISGRSAGISGKIEVNGRIQPLYRSPRAARRAGVAYVPAERKRDGVVMTLPISANLSLTTLERFSRLGVLRLRTERRAAGALAERLHIRSRGVTQLVAELSGGNQQKVMVGSRLNTHPSVLVLQEPTRGVDVGARLEIHRILRESADGGMGILAITSDIEEAVDISDRLLVIRGGRIVAELSGPDKTQADALNAAVQEES